jgi:hypothetical protein
MSIPTAKTGVEAEPAEQSDALASVTDAQNERLSVIEAAEAANVSPATLYRAIRAGVVPARKHQGSMVVMRDVVLKLAPAIRRNGPAGKRDASREDGVIAADAFRRFAAGDTLIDIVQAMSLDPDTVGRLWDSWIALQSKHASSVRPMCGCGAPVNVRNAKCDPCAARSRVLSDEQIARLANAPAPPPSTCHCAGCGSSVAVHLATSLCNPCSGRLGIVVRNGGLAIEVAGRIVRQYTAHETWSMLKTDGPRAPAPAPAEESGPSEVAKGLAELLAEMEKK